MIKGADILDHPIGKLAVENMALLLAGKFEESLKTSNREYNEHDAALPADRKKRMAANMMATAITDAKFRADIQKLGVLTIEGDSATLTMKETTDVGAGLTNCSGACSRRMGPADRTASSHLSLPMSCSPTSSSTASSITC